MKDKFLKNAFIISAGGFISKFMGALYRMSLTNIIGCKGIGLYQLVYPFYSLLLTVSASGVPSAIAKMVADKSNFGGKGIYFSGIKLFSFIGIIGSILLATFAFPISSAQGESDIYSGYLLIAPSVFLVSAMSVYRGWFQGKNNMIPTAVSEIVEQSVKIVFGLFFGLLFRDDVYKAVCFILLSVTLSEAVALVYMYSSFKRIQYNLPLYVLSVGYGKVLKTSLPVTLSSVVLPFSLMADSFIIVKILKKYSFDALSLYGLFSGGAVTLINLPVSVCYGLAAAVIPKIASSDGIKDKNRSVYFSLAVTLTISVPCAIALFVLSPVAVNIVFGRFGDEEKNILVNLVKISSVSAITLSGTQTLSACLTAKGKAGFSAVSMFVSVLVKTGLLFILIDEKNGIYGAAYAVNICYFIAFMLNFMWNLINEGGLNKNHDYDCGIGNRKRRPFEEGRGSCFKRR